jgi:hypothetical protein
MKWTAGRRIRTGARIAGIGSSIVSTSAAPLPVKHYDIQEGCVRSLAYDRETQCLEVRFKWKSVQQYRPVSLESAHEIWKAPPVNVALDNLMKNRRIRFDEVRSEGKMLRSLLRRWRTLSNEK